MPTERQIEETIARCIAIMVYYHNSATSRRANEAMAAEIEAVSAWILGVPLDPDEIARRILQPVEAGLIVRFGHEAGTRINTVFLTSFDKVSLRSSSLKNDSVMVS
jgi:hypothetical protein